MQNSTATPITEVLENLNAGTFAAQIEHALADVALAAVTTGKKGQVVIVFDLKQIGESSQVNITHTLRFKRPKVRGSVIEDTINETPMHVTVGGRLSLFPDRPADFFKSRSTIINEAEGE